jgi:O-antigen ligase
MVDCVNYLLYAAYLGFFICLFLQNDFYLADNVFLFVIVPLALLPIEISFVSSSRLQDMFVFRFEPKNLRYTFLSSITPTFMCAFGFGAMVIISSALQPTWSLIWLLDLTRYLISIAFFMLITSRLSLYFCNFYQKFFFFLSLIASINALINLHAYYLSLSNVGSLALFRLTPSFGRLPDHFPTTGAMTYAGCLVGACGLLAMKMPLLQKKILCVCALILFMTLILMQSRGPLLGAIITILVSHLCAQKSSKFLAIMLSAVAVSVFLMFPKIGQAALERLDGNRLELWDDFWRLACERLLLGYGERIEFLVEASDGSKVGHAHNIFINSIMRGGLLAGICFVAAYTLSAIKTLSFAKEQSNPIPFGLILLVIVAGFVDFDQLVFLADWQWLSFWMPLGFSAACDMHHRVWNMALKEGLKFYV